MRGSGEMIKGIPVSSYACCVLDKKRHAISALVVVVFRFHQKVVSFLLLVSLRLVRASHLLACPPCYPCPTPSSRRASCSIRLVRASRSNPLSPLPSSFSGFNG